MFYKSRWDVYREGWMKFIEFFNKFMIDNLNKKKTRAMLEFILRIEFNWMSLTTSFFDELKFLCIFVSFFGGVLSEPSGND